MENTYNKICLDTLGASSITGITRKGFPVALIVSEAKE